MGYKVRYSPPFVKDLSKLKKRDSLLYQRIRKKIDKIIDNPEHYKPLKKPEAGIRRAHIGSFVIKFFVRGGVIKILTLDHHDEAY